MTNLTIALVVFDELTISEKKRFFELVTERLGQQLSAEKSKLAVTDIEYQNIYQKHNHQYAN